MSKKNTTNAPKREEKTFFFFEGQMFTSFKDYKKYLEQTK